jgi:hypothetical protein
MFFAIWTKRKEAKIMAPIRTKPRTATSARAVVQHPHNWVNKRGQRPGGFKALGRREGQQPEQSIDKVTALPAPPLHLSML